MLTYKLVEGCFSFGLGFLFDLVYRDLQNLMHKLQNQGYFQVKGYFKEKTQTEI